MMPISTECDELGIMEQADRLTRVLTDAGTPARIPLSEASARVEPSKGRGPVSLGVRGMDREGRPFEALIPVPGASMDTIRGMAGEINRSGRAELHGLVFERVRTPGFSVEKVRSGEDEMKVPRVRSENWTRAAERLAVRAREVLREETMGRRRLGDFDKGLVGLTAEIGESLAEMGRGGEIGAARARALPLKGPGSLEGVPLAVQMRLAGSSRSR